MRAVIQRVSAAELRIDGEVHASIGPGLVVLLGVGPDDTPGDVDWLAGKILSMRIFADDEGRMNRSVVDIDGELLVVSQFTLFADTKKGNRPSFLRSAKPDTAIPLYESFLDVARSRYAAERVVAGVFGADMQVSLTNDGPVTIVMDTHQRDF
jgi:D-tyrosyl-tRNA(Tyr) deacylase